MNLLLIHSLVRDKQTVIDSLTEDTKYILINYEIDNLQSIKDRISAFNLSFNRIGLFQENDNMPFYQPTRKFNRSTLAEVEMHDQNLDTWTDFTDLLIFCKEKGMTNFDMMDCNVASDKNWLYIISQLENKLSININASSNETGNSAMSGDWILEKGNINLIGTYFTENIKEYKYTLGGSGGFIHTIILNNKNEVYGCGNNSYGQLGIGGDAYANFTLLSMDLTMIPEGSKVINTKCGRDFTMILLDNGMVYGCGDNNNGQLGIGTTDTPQRTLIAMDLSTIPTGRKIINIACGSLHTIVLLDDGTVYGCGYNSFGQLGIGSTDTPQTTLVAMDLSTIPTGRKIINIACGSLYTIVLLDDGTVYGCGKNSNGQLGIGSIDTPQKTLVEMINIPNGKKVVNIACCLADTLVLLNDGTVYGCGYNLFGELGNGTLISTSSLVQMINIPSERKVINIACGYYYTIILLDNNTVYGCGQNLDGQLGSPYNNYETTLVPMVLSTIPSGKKIINIACGGFHTMVFLDDGTIYTCGSNNNQFGVYSLLTGQLGTNFNGFANNSLAPMKYYNNNNPIDVTDASTATFATIFFNPSAITQIYNGTNNLTLTPSMYKIYTYNPLQPTITINTYTANFNNSNVGKNKTVTISVNQLKDNTNNTNNTNYLFVIPYTTTGTITPAIPESKYKYINRYTTLQSLSTFKVIRTKKRAYVVISYKIKPNELFVEFIQNI